MSSEIRLGSALGFAGLCVPSLVAAQRPGAVRGGEQPMIIDFRAGTAPWRSIDDVVMGGLSSSEMVVSDGVAVFRGEVSLENNGGFASVRSDPGDLDLSDFDRLVLRVRGDGKRYTLRLRTTDSLEGVSYQAPLQPSAGSWQEVTIDFAAFEPVFRGRSMPGHPPLDPSRVRTVGLLIADRQAGPFQIEIAWIRGDREAVTRSRNPVNRNKLPGSKWTAVRPERREKHFAVVDWVPDGDGNPTEHLKIEAVVTGAVRVLHWRELEDPHSWRVGWV